MAFDFTPPSAPQPLTRRQVLALCPTDPRSRYEGSMLRWALAFYSLYGLLCLGLVPTWLFVALAASAFLRYFNRWHKYIHTNQHSARCGAKDN